MQDAQATQPTQPAPPPPPTGAATAVFPGGSVPLQGLPTTPQEVAGLRERREILRDQLGRAVNRRDELVSELNETGNPEARAGLQQRLTLLDERILQIERDQATTEQLLSNAPAEVLALAQARDVQQVGMDDEAAAMLFFFAFALGVVLTSVIGRFRRRRRRRNQTTATVDDGRFERLSQAVDAIAEEVERIGEGQRFVTQLLAQRRESPGLPVETTKK